MGLVNKNERGARFFFFQGDQFAKNNKKSYNKNTP